MRDHAKRSEKRDRVTEREEQQPQRRSPPVGEQRSLSPRIARTPSSSLSLPPSVLVVDKLSGVLCCFSTFVTSCVSLLSPSPLPTPPPAEGGPRCPEPWRAACRKRRRNRNALIRRSSGNCEGTSGMLGENSNSCYSVSVFFLFHPIYTYNTHTHTHIPKTSLFIRAAASSFTRKIISFFFGFYILRLRRRFQRE